LIHIAELASSMRENALMSRAERWPSGLMPESAPVFTHNELSTTVSPAALWSVLIGVTEWPDWYPNAANVRTADGMPTLHLGSQFTWKTVGVTVKSEVVEFEPNRSLAWTARGIGSHGFHRFDFTPADGGGCLITTEEVEAGPGPRLVARRLKRDLLRFHQVWLEELVKRAVS
jgi:hypothetical protein